MRRRAESSRSSASTAERSSSSRAEPPPRVLGPLAGTAIVVGSTFGIGIFIGPPEAARAIDSAPVLLLLWIGAGLIALGGAVACAELAAMMPHAGGDYVYQRRAFGPSFAFASGWLLVAVVFAAALASMSVAVCEFQLSYLLTWTTGRTITLGEPLWASGPVSPTAAHLGAIGVVLAYTLLNVWSTTHSARVQTVCTLVPFSIVAATALGTLVMSPEPAGVATIAEPVAVPALGIESLALAYLPVFFAYSGWNAITYVGGEVRYPERVIPRALVGGLAAITALYAVLTAAFVHALGMDGLRAVGEAGTAAAGVFFGERGRLVMATLMTVALLTCINGATLTGARVAFAMARDGAFWRGASALSGRGTPTRALWVQAAIASGLIFTGTFSELIQICSVAMILGGTFNVLVLFTLRWRDAGAPRPYRAWAHPWLPALSLVPHLFVIAVMVRRAFAPGVEGARPWYPLLGLGLFAGVWVGHAASSRRRRRS